MTSPIPAPAGVPTTQFTGNLTPKQIDQLVLTNVSPHDPPAAKTLVYSPEARILIAHGNKQFDVSNDITAVSVQRVENSVSSVVFRLANKDLRYNQLFERMDRVVVYLKRVRWVQVFSGYLDSVPHVQLYPGTVNFRASCTIKRLLHTWWDPGLPNSAKIFDQAGLRLQEEQETGEQSADQGLGSLLRRLLVEVGGWSSSNVHIQRFPTGYTRFMEQMLKKYEPGANDSVETFKRLLLGSGDTSLGVGAAAGRQVGVTRGSYTLAGQPDRMLEVIRTVDEMGMGPNNTELAAAQGLGVAAKGGSDNKDRPAWQGEQELSKNWSEASMKNDAAVHCFMTIMVEAPGFVMYANNAVPESLNYPYDAIGSDGTSTGLYQQTQSSEWGSVAQRMNVRESTGMFLQHLARLDWRNMDRGTACQQVQRSAFPGKYAQQEQAAIDAVRSIRSGTGTTSSGQRNNPIPGTDLGGTPLTSIPSPITAGAPSTSPIPSLPTQNGSPSPAGAGAQAGRPQYDTQSVISCGMSLIGRPYVWGAKGPATFDCSGFTHYCYASMGLEIGGDTYAQANRGQKIPFAQAVPGDLLEPPDQSHVVIWLGGNQILHAPQPGDVVKISSLYFTPGFALHFPPATYGGPGFAPFDPSRANSSSGAIPGTVDPGLDNGTYQTGGSEPIARNLFTYQFFPGQFTNTLSTLYGGQRGREEAAFINDEPLIQTVVSFAKAGMRNFQSAPNGDFVAYYPDYFGLDGKDAEWDLEDIEMKNVQIDLNDDALATHVYVSGSPLPNGAGAGNPVGWLNTKGIATVENEWLFRRMTLAAPHVPGENLTSGKEMMKKFGVRPLTMTMSSIQAGAMEFLVAMQIFMTKWAEQYATQVEITFMPELQPGMRLNLVGHNLQVYVTAVTHSGDFENGFTTTATIMAPSNPNIRKLLTQLISPTNQETQNQNNLAANSSEALP